MGENLCNNFLCKALRQRQKTSGDVVLAIILSSIMSRLNIAGCHGSVIGGNHIYGVCLKVYLKVYFE